MQSRTFDDFCQRASGSWWKYCVLPASSVKSAGQLSVDRLTLDSIPAGVPPTHHHHHHLTPPRSDCPQILFHNVVQFILSPTRWSICFGRTFAAVFSYSFHHVKTPSGLGKTFTLLAPAVLCNSYFFLLLFGVFFWSSCFFLKSLLPPTSLSPSSLWRRVGGCWIQLCFNIAEGC